MTAMRWKLSAALALSSLASCHAASTAQTKPAVVASNQEPAKAGEKAIPSDLVEQLERASDIGAQLYVLDKAAAIATDTVRAHVATPDQYNLQGYVPLAEGNDQGEPTGAFLVSFFTKEQPPRLRYQVRIEAEKQPEFSDISPPRAFPPEMVELIRARQLAIASLPEVHQPLNPVMLPAEAIGEHGILVYLLAGTSKPDLAVFGKHFRVVVPPGAKGKVAVTPLSKSELEVPTRGADGTLPEALMVTHLLGDAPLETHVFVSLLVKLPVFVKTQRGLWRVHGSKIAFFGDVAVQGA